MKINLPEPLNSLTGGLESKAITNFYGAPGTGKTNFCLLAAIECIRSGGSVVYVDTEGGFSVERLKQLAPDCARMLQGIELLEPKSFADQGRMIRSLEGREARMIIVDSMVALYRLEHSEDKKAMAERMEPVRELSKQLSILSNISRDKDIPVLITSHMFRGWDDGQPDVVGGDLMKYWSKTMVYLEKTSRMSERKATIVKHRSAPEGGNVKFNIVNEGIKPSRFRVF
jgi:DNA repair protein RadB